MPTNVAVIVSVPNGAALDAQPAWPAVRAVVLQSTTSELPWDAEKVTVPVGVPDVAATVAE